MTDNVSGKPNAGDQQVDPRRFGAHISYSQGDHPINIDLAVQVVFLQYNQVMNLRTQDKLDETQATLDLLNEARHYYNKMKELKKQAPDCDHESSRIPDDMKKFLTEHGVDHLAYDDNLYTANEWDINMADLDSYIQKISGQNKTQMLELNQCVEDGNNALREVSTVFSKYSEIIQSIIQTVNR